MLNLRQALVVGAALVSTLFAMAIFERYLARKRPQELFWCASLVCFTFATAALACAIAFGWTPLTFRVFYLFGGICCVPLLALGSVWLTHSPKVATRVTRLVIVLLIFASGVLSVAPIDNFEEHVRGDNFPQGSEVFGALPRTFAAVGSGVAALYVVAIALTSAVKSRGARYTAANSLIAFGTLVTSAKGLLPEALGEYNSFAISLAAGITLIFIGFVLATTAPKRTGAKQSSN